MYSWHYGTKFGAFPTITKFKGENPIALPAFLADPKDTFDN